MFAKGVDGVSEKDAFVRQFSAEGRTAVKRARCKPARTEGVSRVGQVLEEKRHFRPGRLGGEASALVLRRKKR